jgi:hypothetical protein
VAHSKYVKDARRTANTDWTFSIGRPAQRTILVLYSRGCII